MYQYNKFFFWIIILCSSITIHAQAKDESVEKIMGKASEAYTTKQYYTYNIKYALFNDFTSKKANENYTGFLLKKDNVYYYKIKSTEFVGFKEYSVKVNSEEKAILIGKQVKNEFPLDLKKYLKAFKTKIIKSDNLTWTCELVPDKISQIMFSKVIMVINKRDYSVSKQILYFLNTINEGKVEQSPRLEITFSPRNSDKNTDNLLVDQSKYFTKVGNNIKVASRFKEYHLYKE